MNPIFPLLGLGCWMAAMTAVIYGRRGWAWIYMIAAFALFIAGLLLAR